MNPVEKGTTVPVSRNITKCNVGRCWGIGEGRNATVFEINPHSPDDRDCCRRMAPETTSRQEARAHRREGNRGGRDGVGGKLLMTTASCARCVQKS